MSLAEHKPPLEVLDIPETPYMVKIAEKVQPSFDLDDPTKLRGYDVSFDVHEGSEMVAFVIDPGEPVVVGDIISFFGKGFGFPIRGIAVNGKVVRYETEAEFEVRREAENEVERAKRRVVFEAKLDEYEARIKKLPQIFQDRLAGFASRDKDFGPEYLSYELFCCEQAVIIAAAAEGVPDFFEQTKDPNELIKRVPNLDEDQTGNTLGASRRFAYLSVNLPHLVAKEHAAICPLIGCQAASCWVTGPEAMELMTETEGIADVIKETLLKIAALPVVEGETDEIVKAHADAIMAETGAAALLEKLKD